MSDTPLERMCHHCTKIQPAFHRRCSFCRAKQPVPHSTHNRSLQRSWAYLITAILLYIPANILPIMTATTLGSSSDSTIISGVVQMWDGGAYFVAAVIFIASIFIPIAKFLALMCLCLSQQFNWLKNARTKIVIYRMTEFVGRWSMVDVFVVAFLASLIQIGALASITPGPAALSFGAMVLFTMLSASSLDTGTFWGCDEHNR